MSRYNNSIVTINLSTHPPKAPLGILLAPSFQPNNSTSTTSSLRSTNTNNITLLAGWEHIPTTSDQTTQLGPIQRSGLVRLGDRLVQINGRDISDIPFSEVMEALRRFLKRGTLKSMGFAPRHSREWNTDNNTTMYESENGGAVLESSLLRQHERRGYTFTSFVNRWRVMMDSVDDTDVDFDEREEDDELEQHLNKDPCNNKNNNNKKPASNQSPAPPKPYIQYEIQCHLTFHTKSIRKNSTSSNSGNNTYTWSVWKRYSELRLLDIELRGLYGWQMDALEEGRGISFPRERYLTTFWYDVYDAVNTFLFGASSWSSDENINSNKDDVKDTTLKHPDTTNIQYPYPPQFISKRQKELQFYWSTLMRLEDIFEFDIHHPKYSKVMSSFLQVDTILMKRSAASVASNRRPAVIREEIVESNDDGVGYGELILPLGGIPILGREEDEVSLLSDGTGLRESSGALPLVDPIASSLRNGHNASYGERKLVGGIVSASSSVVSGSSANSKRRMGPRHGAKPAFQREYLGL